MAVFVCFIISLIKDEPSLVLNVYSYSSKKRGSTRRRAEEATIDESCQCSFKVGKYMGSEEHIII